MNKSRNLITVAGTEVDLMSELLAMIKNKNENIQSQGILGLIEMKKLHVMQDIRSSLNNIEQRKHVSYKKRNPNYSPHSEGNWNV